MSRLRRSLAAAVVTLLVLGLLWPTERPRLGADSFGVAPPGTRALFELLLELGIPVERSYAAPADLDPRAVVWWVAPHGPCRPAEEPAADDEADDASGDVTGEQAEDAPGRSEPVPAWDPRPWLEAGGTAVVFLPGELRWPFAAAARATGGGRCERLGPFLLPPRDAGPEVAAPPEEALAGSGPDAEPDPAEDAEPDAVPGARELFDDWWRGEPDASEELALSQRVEGPLARAPRELRGPALRRFRTAGDFAVRASLSDGPGDDDGDDRGAGEEPPSAAPFVLERRHGAGRLVVVADAAFLTNERLDRGDAAPLALDLVRAYGAPRLDEREHGLRREQRPLAYLAASPALPVFVALALLGLLALWRGAALPRRAVVEADPSAPELERFVDSLATLYARSHDHARVGRRYRELSVARLRRHFGLGPELPDRAVLERLHGEGRLAGSGLEALDPEAAVPLAGAAELHASIRRLDALVKEACR